MWKNIYDNIPICIIGKIARVSMLLKHINSFNLTVANLVENLHNNKCYCKIRIPVRKYL